MTTRKRLTAAPIATPWNCQHCNGDQMCRACEREIRLRTVAVRLLSCPESPHFDELMRGTDRHSGPKRAEALRLIDDMVARLRCGVVSIPATMPTRVRADDERRIKFAHGVYRALGDGVRRRVKDERRR